MVVGLVSHPPRQRSVVADGLPAVVGRDSLIGEEDGTVAIINPAPCVVVMIPLTQCLMFGNLTKASPACWGGTSSEHSARLHRERRDGRPGRR